jgi:hypothetical protein
MGYKLDNSYEETSKNGHRMALGVTPIAITENILFPNLIAPWWSLS